jgi:PAS domain S-box-containing protein
MSDRFAEMFQYANEAIFLLDPEGDRILDVNIKACNLLGYAREELLQRPVSAIHPDGMSQLMRVKSCCKGRFLRFIPMECRSCSPSYVPNAVRARVGLII